MATRIEPDGPAASGFTGRIDRRLSLVFGSLFALVLLVGGTSLYLLGSLLLRSETIGRESEHVHLEEQMHRTVQDLLSAIERAQLRGQAIPEAVPRVHLSDLESLLARYQRTGGEEPIVREMRAIVASTERLAQSVATAPGVAPAAGPVTGAQGPDLLESTRRSLQALTERMSTAHAASEQLQIQQTDRTLKVTIAINVAFVVVSSLLLLGAHRHFHRAIAVPLRHLTERSNQIAAGGLDRAIPVTSTDEIGRLGHAFNRMAEQLREHEEKLKGLVILEERERLARELHDDLAQDIAVLRLKLAGVERGLASSPDAETRAAVTEMLGIVDAAYRNLRSAIFGLRALDVASSGGLLPALADYLADFGAIRRIPVQLRAAGGEALAFAPHTEQQLFRIVHEALTNVVKHAHATRAVVTLAREGDTARIAVEDDGIGFVVDKPSDDGPHFGLPTMRERAQAVGGSLAIESAPGHGTKLILNLPLAKT